MSVDKPDSSSTSLPDTLEGLEARLDGAVDASDRTRRLYATDASIY